LQLRVILGYVADIILLNIPSFTTVAFPESNLDGSTAVKVVLTIIDGGNFYLRYKEHKLEISITEKKCSKYPVRISLSNDAY
jgi:hypothetical protein